jgi:hypothetical protein
MDRGDRVYHFEATVRWQGFLGVQFVLGYELKKNPCRTSASMVRVGVESHLLASRKHFACAAFSYKRKCDRAKTLVLAI